MAWGQEWDPQMWPLRGTFWGKRMGVGLGETGGWSISGAISPSLFPRNRILLERTPCLQTDTVSVTRFTGFARHGTVGLL